MAISTFSSQVGFNAGLFFDPHTIIYRLTNLFKTMRLSSLALLVLLNNVTPAAADLNGRAAPPLYKDKPFVVVWNKPTHRCPNVHQELEKWGIVVNSHGKFIGDKISLFYEPGIFPHYSRSKPRQPIHGGLPQLGDIDAHMKKLAEIVNSEIPNPDFSGLGIIDWEGWRPVFDSNYGVNWFNIYRDKSKELVRSKQPNLSNAEVYNQARKEFEQSAREYFEGSLDLVRKLRPGGKYGFYYFPRRHCDNTRSFNNKLKWMYKLSSGLFPRTYISNRQTPSSESAYVRDTVMEALRVKDRWCDPETAIMPYGVDSSGNFDFHNESYLHISIGKPADMGVSGVVLWGSWDRAKANFKDNKCKRMVAHIKNTLGPYSQRVTNFFSECSKTLCSCRGRCVRRDYDKQYQDFKRDDFSKEEDTKQRNDDRRLSGVEFNNPPTPDIKDYVCRCYTGCSGQNCENPKSDASQMPPRNLDQDSTETIPVASRAVSPTVQTDHGSSRLCSLSIYSGLLISYSSSLLSKYVLL